jgi:hypothetical protein
MPPIEEPGPPKQCFNKGDKIQFTYKGQNVIGTISDITLGTDIFLKGADDTIAVFVKPENVKKMGGKTRKRKLKHKYF